MEQTRAALPDDPAHARVFDYNAAVAYHRLGDFPRAAAAASELVQVYFDMLEITPLDVFGASPADLHAKLRDTGHLQDDCKHLADCLDLLALATNACGRDAAFARVHAMMFYQLAQALNSLIRVGHA